MFLISMLRLYVSSDEHLTREIFLLLDDAELKNPGLYYGFPKAVVAVVNHGKQRGNNIQDPTTEDAISTPPAVVYIVHQE